MNFLKLIRFSATLGRLEALLIFLADEDYAFIEGLKTVIF